MLATLTNSKAPILALLAVTRSACISPESYESEPVNVETPIGVVTCQLYTRDLVIWDRAIDRPEGMTVSTADAICVNEGQRRSEPEIFQETGTAA
ncbi:MAG: hypothetical protein HKP37_02100 [Boseongicola sp.]|nr:hypothetical protein [Boseongicola sp.]NNL17510.1 hypothetical protein [Boseongicola sp.]